jgi:large subunit ribosomal protein L9
MDVAQALKDQGYEIDRRKIVLREPIKRFGSYEVPVRLHRDVTVQLPVSVLGEGGIEIDVTALDAEAGGEPAAKAAPVEAAPPSEAAAETDE